MPLPKEITFTLEGEPILDIAPPAPPKEGELPKDPPTAPPVFGVEYGGQFSVRLPTLGDQLVIRARTQAYFERCGVQNVLGLDDTTHRLCLALVAFEVLATEKPAWCSLDAAGDMGALIAVLRAKDVMDRKIEDAKKKPAADGASS